LVGTAADPAKRSFFKVAVGRATPSISLRAVRLSNGVPANGRSISGCGSKETTPPGRGSKSV